MVSVTNPDLTSATSFATLRTADLGKSTIPLLAVTEAIFPLQTRASAVFAAPATGTFFALALQNPGPADSIVSVELWDAGEAVASATLTLPSGTKVSREVSELFPGVIPGAESVLAVTATVTLLTPPASPELSKDGIYLRESQPNNLLRWDLEVEPSRNGEKAMPITYEFRMELDRQMAITGFQSR